MLCDRLGIFVDGQLVCIGNPKELTARHGGYYVRAGAPALLGVNRSTPPSSACPRHPTPPPTHKHTRALRPPTGLCLPACLPTHAAQVFTITTPPEQEGEADALVRRVSPGARLTYALAGTRKYELPVGEVTLPGEPGGSPAAGCGTLDMPRAVHERVSLCLGWPPLTPTPTPCCKILSRSGTCTIVCLLTQLGLWLIIGCPPCRRV